MSKDMGCCHLQEIYPINMEKKLFDTATKTGLDAAKTVSKKAVHKTAEATEKLIGKKSLKFL